MYSHDVFDSRLKGRHIGWVVVAGLGFLLFMAVGGNALFAGLGVIHDSSEPAGATPARLAGHPPGDDGLTRPARG